MVLCMDQTELEFELAYFEYVVKHFWHYDIYIYIYIVIHRHTVSLYHNSSVWRDRKDTESWDRNPPKFTSALELYGIL